MILSFSFSGSKAASPRNICSYFSVSGFLRCSAPEYQHGRVLILRCAAPCILDGGILATNISVRCTLFFVGVHPYLQILSVRCTSSMIWFSFFYKCCCALHLLFMTELIFATNIIGALHQRQSREIFVAISVHVDV